MNTPTTAPTSFFARREAEQETLQSDTPAATVPLAPRVQAPEAPVSFVQRRENQQLEQARMMLNVYRGTTAERAISALQMSEGVRRDLGMDLPPERFFDIDESTNAVAGRLREIELQRNVRRNSGLASWATGDPVNAIMVREYGQELGALGAIFNSLRFSAEVAGIAVSYSQLTASAQKALRQAETAQGDRGLGYFEIVQKIREEAEADGNAPFEGEQPAILRRLQELDRFVTKEGRKIFAPITGIDRRLKSIFAPDDDTVVEAWRQAAQDALEREQFAMRGAEQRYQRAERVTRVQRRLSEVEERDDLQGWDRNIAKVEALLSNPVDAAAFIGTVVLESAAPLAAGVAATRLTGLPSYGVGVSSAGGAAMAQTLSVPEIAAEYGYDLTNKDDLKAFIRDPRSRNLTRDRANAYALTLLAVNTLAGGIATSQMTQSVAGEVLLQGLAQGVMGSSSELLALLASDRDFDLLEIALEGVAEMVTTPIEVFGIAGQSITAERRRRRAAEDSRAFFEALADTATNSEMRAKVPEKYAEAVAALTKDGPVATVQVDATALPEMFQSGQLTPEQLVQLVPTLSVDKINLAIEEGAFLDIPTSVYAANIAGGDLDALLRPHMSVNNSLTAAQLDALKDVDLNAEVESRIREVEAGVRKTTTAVEEARRSLSDQLVATNRRVRAVADQEARLITTFAEVMAERMGVPFDQFIQRYPLMRFYGQDRDTATPLTVRVDQLQSLRNSGSPEGEVIEAAAAAAGLDETATNEELAEALEAYTADRTPPGEGDLSLDQSVELRRGNETLEPFGVAPGQPLTIRELGEAMNRRHRAVYGEPLPRGDLDEAEVRQVADMMTDEVLFELRDMPPESSGAGWYDTKFQQALDTVGVLFPELLADDQFNDKAPLGVQKLGNKQNARDFMTALIAITSDGADPRKNLKAAVELYKKFRRYGHLRGKHGKSHRNVNLDVNRAAIDRLLEREGPAGMHKYLMRRATVREIRAALRAEGQTNPLPTFGPDEELPVAAAVFGAKLGSFYANLMGDAGYLTMDRWWTRTISRLRGDMLPAVVGLADDPTTTTGKLKGVAAFKAEVGRPDMSDADALFLARELYDERQRTQSYRLGKKEPKRYKMAATITKAAFLELNDAPTGPADRRSMIRIAQQVRQNLRAEGYDVSIADIQAVMWYYEKRLFGMMGTRETRDESYAEAAKAIYADDIARQLRAEKRRARVADVSAQEAVRSGQPVTAEDLDRGIDENFLRRPGWATATYQRDQRPSEPDLAYEFAMERARDQFFARLEHDGIAYKRLEGRYGGPVEDSVIMIADEAYAARLGRDFNQDSILTYEGFLYTSRTAPRSPATGVILTGQDAIDAGFYSVTEDGQAFALEIDFSVGPGKAVAPVNHRFHEGRPQLPVRDIDGKVPIFHGAPTELASVDPARAGSSGGAGLTRFQRQHKLSYWGIAPRREATDPGTGYVPERAYAVWHRALVDPKQLYPYWDDPDKLRPTRSEAPTQEAADSIYYRRVREAGYLGIYTEDDGSGASPLGNVAILFEEIPVEVVSESEVFLPAGSTTPQDIPGVELNQGPPGTRSEVVEGGGGVGGDGRSFANFFSDVTKGVRQQPKNLDQYVPAIPLPDEVVNFAANREKFSGNFEDHIRTSIPGYREMQDAVGYAISQVIGRGSLLSIGGSEGAMAKAVVEANPGATAVVADPNQDMADTFNAKPQVKGVSYAVEAFGMAEDVGKIAWTEDDGRKVRFYNPRSKQFDIVDEMMVFQFISNSRADHIARSKELMAPGGLFITAEKLGGPRDEYLRNEAKKDEYKAQYYDAATLEAKRQEVLRDGGDEIEGMTALQVSAEEMETILKRQFAHVAQYWDSGNFKGYVASDDPARLEQFLEALPDLSSDYATVSTPRRLETDVELFQSDVRQSEAFARWFEGSKAVDANGEPAVVYHGVDPGRVFSAFNEGEYGIFFAETLELARTYSNTRRDEGTTRPVSVEVIMEDPEQVGFKIRQLSDEQWEVRGPDDWPFVAETREIALHMAAEDYMEGLMPDRYHGRVYSMYLRLRDPFEIDAGGANWDSINVDGDDEMYMVEYDDEDGDLQVLTGLTREQADAIEEKFGGAIISAMGMGTMSTNELSRMAREMGHDGVIIRNVTDEGPFGRGYVGEQTVYIVFDPAQAKSTENFGTFDPRNPDTMFQRNRGSIVLPPQDARGRAPVVNLFETADLSTVLHESAHWFLWVTEQMVADGSAPESVLQDYDRLKQWWQRNRDAIAKEAGVEPDQVTDYLRNGKGTDEALNRAIYTALQEQFARGFEAYLMEGKAPSTELMGLFDTFMSWLLSVYRRVANLQVNLDDEVRSVFDRMLAADEEIAKAKARNNHVDLVASSAEQLGITEAEYQELVRLSVQATDEAKKRLLLEVMAPLRAQRTEEYERRKDVVQAEVSDEIGARPEHRMVQWLGNERWVGGQQPDAVPSPRDLRIDRQMLIDEYGASVLSRLPRGRQVLYAEGTAMSPDEVAGWFGFGSGDQMIQTLLTMPRFDAAVEARVRQRMAEEIGDPLADGEIEARAVEALNSDKRGALIDAELRALGRNRSRSTPRTTRSAAREIARRRVASMPVREAVAYQRYLQAMQRNAVDAQRAVGRGDLDAAYDLKRKELLNHALYMEAREAAKQLEQGENTVRRLRKKGSRKNIDGTYLAAIDEIMDRYDFRKSMTAVQERRRGSLAAYIQMMVDSGRANELAIPDHVLAETRRRPYRTLSMAEFRGVIASLQNIEHTGRRKKKLIDAKNQRELDATVAEIVSEAEAALRDRPAARARSSDTGAPLRSYLNLLLNADTLLREAGGRRRGAAYDAIKEPIDDAADVAQDMREKAATEIEQLYSRYTRSEMNRMAKVNHYPTLRTRGDQNPRFSKWDLISMALNMGNQTNLDRLMDRDNGFGYSAAQIEFIKQQLDSRDWDFVQSVWDYLETFWPMIAEREKRQTGVAPEKVEPLEVVVGGRSLRGGYYPIAYDPRFKAASQDEQIAELQLNMMGGRFGKAQTSNGHTKARAKGSGGRVMELGMQVFHQHVGRVIHDLAYGEVVNNAWRILQHPDLVALYERKGRNADRQSLELWVQDVATGPVTTGGVFGRGAARLKNTFTLSKLAFNLSTVMIQMTGVPQSMVVVGKANFIKGLHTYFSNPERWVEEVKAASPFMRARETTFQRDIYDMMDDTISGPTASAWHRWQLGIGRIGYWLLMKVQFYGIDMPTWLAGYEQGLQLYKNDEAKARKHADRMVARAQASGLMGDRSAFERGTLSPDTRQNGFVKLFTTLGSYMFAKGNIAYERLQQGRADVTGFDVKSFNAAISTAFDMTLLFTLEAVLYYAIKGQLPGDDDDEDDPEVAWAKFLARETMLSILSSIPVGRDVGSAMSGFSGGGAYGSIAETFAAPMIQAAQGEVDLALIKAVSNAAGVAVGYPSSAVNRVIDGLWRINDGDDVAPVEFLMGRRM